MVSLADISIARGYEADGGQVEDLSYLAMESVFTAPDIGRDERRMQVRAYNHWLAAVQDGELPPVEELRPEELDDLGPSGVLVDLTLGLARPAIIFLGEKLAAECGDEREIFNLGDVPERSLLSRLTEHCLEVVANRAPVGFDAEFIDRRGQIVLYRSILLPYSSDGSSADFIFGVISWKHGGTAEREPAPAVRSAPAQARSAVSSAPSLADLLGSARELAALARTSEERSHRALYAAIGRLHDCALAARRDPAGLDALLGQAGTSISCRTPLVALARLAFGPDWPRSRLSEIALVLDHAWRHGLAGTALEELLAVTPGGLKGLVNAERALHRDTRPHAIRPGLTRKLRERQAIGTDAIEAEFALLVARRELDGTLAILGDPGEVRLLEAAAKRLLAT